MDISTSTAASALAHIIADRVDPNAVGQPQQHSRQIKKQHGVGQAAATLLAQLDDLRDKRHRRAKGSHDPYEAVTDILDYLSLHHSRWLAAADSSNEMFGSL